MAPPDVDLLRRTRRPEAVKDLFSIQTSQRRTPVLFPIYEPTFRVLITEGEMWGNSEEMKGNFSGKILFFHISKLL